MEFYEIDGFIGRMHMQQFGFGELLQFAFYDLTGNAKAYVGGTDANFVLIARLRVFDQPFLWL